VRLLPGKNTHPFANQRIRIHHPTGLFVLTRCSSSGHDFSTSTLCLGEEVFCAGQTHVKIDHEKIGHMTNSQTDQLADAASSPISYNQ